MCLCKQGTGGAEAKDLAAELLERGTALVVYVGFRDESADGACFLKAKAELDIFATNKVLIVTPYRAEEPGAHAHIKAARLVGCKSVCTAAYASCGEEAGHRKVDGFLQVGKIGRSGIGTAEERGVRVCFEEGINGAEVAGRNDAIAVEEDVILGRGQRGCAVASI